MVATSGVTCHRPGNCRGPGAPLTEGGTQLEAQLNDKINILNLTIDIVNINDKCKFGNG